MNSGWENDRPHCRPASLLLVLGGLGQDVGLLTLSSASSATPPLCKAALEWLVAKAPVVRAPGSGRGGQHRILARGRNKETRGQPGKPQGAGSQPGVPRSSW